MTKWELPSCASASGSDPVHLQGLLVLREKFKMKHESHNPRSVESSGIHAAHRGPGSTAASDSRPSTCRTPRLRDDTHPNEMLGTVNRVHA